jgi:hypothetical protein
VRPTQHEHDRIVTYSGAAPAVTCRACAVCAAEAANRRSESLDSDESKETIKPNKRRD